MPALIERVSKPTFPIIPLGFGSEGSPEPQGEAGRLLLSNAQDVLCRWTEELAEKLNASIGFVIAGAHLGTMPYGSVPATRTFYVKTRYVFLGEGDPMPFELDDE